LYETFLLAGARTLRLTGAFVTKHCPIAYKGAMIGLSAQSSQPSRRTGHSGAFQRMGAWQQSPGQAYSIEIACCFVTLRRGKSASR
jgi:hypothetical protein